MKRLFILGPLFAFGLLATASYAARELIAALFLFSVGFATLLLITIICFLVPVVAHGGAIWYRIRAPLWNPVGSRLDRIIREAGRSFLRLAVRQRNSVAFSLSSRRGDMRIGSDREHGPDRGNHHCPHGAGPC